jgi:mRNA-degrading endonuclease YafQ of YafQ-DinJ toxin-antitoxin module
MLTIRAARLKSGAALEAAIEAAAKGADAPARRGPNKARASCVIVDARCSKQSSQFKRDFKQETKGLYRQVIKDEFLALVSILAQDHPLAEKYRYHALIGRWKDHHDCHI